MNKDDKKYDVDERHICRAIIQPKTDDESEEMKDFDFVAVAVPAENGQVRYSYDNDEYFIQVLRTGQNNIDTSRLASGLPLFDNHPWDNSAANTLGITTAFEFTNEGLVVRAKLGARADEALRQDIKAGIIKTVSIEGMIQKYSIERKTGELPRYYAELWTPESLSFAPVPNDIAAQINVQRAINKQIQEKPEKDNYKSLINKF